MTYIRKKTIEGLKIGDAFTVVRTFTEEDTMKFGEMSHDYNPVHYSDQFAASKKFKGRICHGLLVGSLITEIGGQIGWLATGMNFKFIKPVYFGDTITCKVTINNISENGKSEASALYVNQDGVVVIAASLTGFIPNEFERKIMEKL